MDPTARNDLPQLMQALPQELWDDIYDRVFAVDSSVQLPQLMLKLPQEVWADIYDRVFAIDSGSRRIDKDYKPPARIQVDRHSRSQYAAGFYGNDSTFVLDRRYQLRWGRSLNREHFDKIFGIQYPLTAGNFLPEPSDGIKSSMLRKIEDFEALMRCFGYEHERPEGAVSCRLAFTRKGERGWIVWKMQRCGFGVIFTKLGKPW